MTNEEILEQQIETLEKLLKLKGAVIEELEAKVARLQTPQFGYVPGYTSGYIQPLTIGGGGQAISISGGGGIITSGATDTVTITNADGISQTTGNLFTFANTAGG